MKWRYYLYSLLGCVLFFSCYNEDTLTDDASGEDLVRFEFPQGTNSWDDDVVAIKEKFNVCIIYKDFQASDLNRTWTGSIGSQTYFGEGLKSDEQAEFMISFMKNHVFAYLNPAITQKVFPMYYYMVYDCHAPFVFGPYNLKAPMKNIFDGMDYWSLCMFYGESDAMSDMLYGRLEAPETPEDFWEWRGVILYKILEKAYEKGNIIMPEEFQTGIDYRTEVESDPGTEGNPNYYAKRGFPGLSVTYTRMDALKSIGNTNPSKNFFAYIHLGMRYTSEELEAKHPKANNPLLWEKRQYVLNYMKTKYDLDLEAIAKIPAVN
ncbi:hypothetical protein AALK14_22140 [Butyricimonas hominis]|uniref:hypothetical protein n=1 Tax=Butyricimonas hominis TaxID=2763032 RepID=UPI003511D89D